MHKVGQRWFSEAEPELGLGIILQIEHKFLDVGFPAANETRKYGIKTAPLKRVSYQVGDSIQTEDGHTLEVEDVQENEGVLFYLCQGQVIPEMSLKSALSFTRPQDKLFAGNIDNYHMYLLRYESTMAMRRYQLFPHKGMLGSKVSLLPHQLYLVDQLTNRPYARAMLADEVGLGKTIEAGLILKSQVLQDKVKRCLIIVPDSLVYQWFIEMFKKFGLRFHTISDNNELEVEANDFNQGAHYIVGLRRLMNTPELQEELLEQNWDMLIVDEAHQIRWTPEQASAEYQLVKVLSEKIQSMLLLSATPEILGKQGHFARLHLLDPQKFSDYDSFIQQEKSYGELIPTIKNIINDEYEQKDLLHFFNEDEINHFTNKDEILSALLDRHGTGRVYFRNTRENMEKNHQSFPKRLSHPHPIEIEGKIEDKFVFAHKVNLLKDLMESHPQDKILVITHSRQLVQKIQKTLSKLTNAKMAMFHSEQSLMERDRQAAYFADPDGANLLLCTEVGSEGRNFEFAKHLFLMDIPKVADQLEQRIGRLDRIGQQNDINIHIPYIKNTFEELLFHWYSEVLKSFKEAPKGASRLHQEFKDRIHQLIEAPYDAKATFAFLEDASKRYQAMKLALSQGHDLLLDLNSYRPQEANKILSEIREFTQDNDLRAYLLQVFDAIGVHTEELNNNSDYIRPTDTMLIPAYPGLSNDGVSVSYNRDFCLKRDDIEFMSWENPLAQGSLELFMTTELGNMTVTSHQGHLQNTAAIEFIFKLDVHDNLGSRAYHYLPLTPIRVLLTTTGSDITKELPKKKCDAVCVQASKEQSQQVTQIPRDQFKLLMDKAQQIALKRSIKYREKANEELNHQFGLAIDRLNDLARVNGLVSKDEIEQLKLSQQKLIAKIKDAEVAIDAIRIILP
jgi:ATP-dependent helicase HepA